MQRSKNFTNVEKHDLLNIIFLYRHVIENKETDNITNLQKYEAWTNITIEYNKNKTTIRSEKNLRLCWDNIKKDTRKYYATLKCESYKTGGGVITLEKNNLFERAREIIGEVTVHGLINPFDSDFGKENISNSTVNNMLQEDNENDLTQIFSYLIENKEISDRKSWDTKKLKIQKSFPLQIQDTPTTSNSMNSNKMKLKNNNIETLNEAKTELIHRKKNFCYRS
ncbi:uncharacterized protein LOC109611251 [Ooceraea biroi]|uniref:uncharacterized protein LOC109611251 n=1 Tax=Ooceraea biroi TaxID=2015173 RepID=UPI0009716BE3|nr:uncharacterized protein LOC109611251 [Ooceraea biroi]